MIFSLVAAVWFSPAMAWAGPMDQPLIRAAYFGDIPAVERLLAAGADIEETDERGRTPLMWAAYKGRTAVVRLLLSKGARIEAVSRAGVTALIAAGQGGDPEVTTLLISRGANLAAKDYKGRNAGAWAAKRHHSVLAGALGQGITANAK